MIKAYMKDQVIIRTAQSDKYGDRTYYDSMVFGRIDYKNQLVRDPSGEQVTSTAVVLLADRILTVQDLLQFDNVDHAILQITKRRDFSTRYLEVYVA